MRRPKQPKARRLLLAEPSPDPQHEDWVRRRTEQAVQEMAAFDRLPRAARRVISGSAFEVVCRVLPRLDPATIALMSEHDLYLLLLTDMRRAETQSLRLYADKYAQSYGHPLPHVAAKVRLQRD
jgi:hypothetical protein